MDFISIGIGLVGVGSTLILKSISYVRSTDRAIARIELDLRDYIAEARRDIASIRGDLERIQERIDAVGEACDAKN
jgi:hypothetical protein